MRFGLIGYGAWGRHHAAAIEKVPGASVVAIACRTEASAADARRDFPRAVVYLDYRQLLERADVDAVDVVVPNDLHVEIGVAALEHGKDVLLEVTERRPSSPGTRPGSESSSAWRPSARFARGARSRSGEHGILQAHH